jgi:hypothetical protein
MKNHLLAMLFLLPSILMAQQEPDKIEIEERISDKEVPSLLKQKVAELFDSGTKIKWYRETNDKFQNFEAKLINNRKRFSVEFDTLFNIQDIEIEQKKGGLPDDAQIALTKYFEETYSSYKIKRIQLQVSGEYDKLVQYVKKGNLDQLQISYEIEFEGKQEGVSMYYEGLFEESGSLIRRRNIVLNTSDNISY